MGEALLDRLAQGRTQDPGATPVDRFWSGLSDLLRRRGWGSLEVDDTHPGIAVCTLRAPADEAGGDFGHVREEFAAGIISGVLEHVAGAEFGVHTLASDGPGHHVFAVGSPEAVEVLADSLRADPRPFTDALGDL